MKLHLSELLRLADDLPRPIREGEQRRFIIRPEMKELPFSKDARYPGMSEMVEDGILIAEYCYDERMGRDILKWVVRKGKEEIILDIGRSVGYPWPV